jgi:hypothetical protein
MVTTLRSWPATLDEAVDLIISSMARDEKQEIQCMAEEDIIFLHFGLGRNIRNQCGLWAGNIELLHSCGSERIHPDDAAMVIIEALWRKLQTRH